MMISGPPEFGLIEHRDRIRVCFPQSSDEDRETTFRIDVNVVKSSRTHPRSDRRFESSGLAGRSCRNISCFLALLWPKCDSLAGNLHAAAYRWRGSSRTPKS